MLTTANVHVGASVYEVTMYGLSYIGTVDRTFNSLKRPGMVHSVRLDTCIPCGGRGLQVQTVLYWSRTRWKNRLDRRAEYIVRSA